MGFLFILVMVINILELRKEGCKFFCEIFKFSNILKV